MACPNSEVHTEQHIPLKRVKKKKITKKSTDSRWWVAKSCEAKWESCCHTNTTTDTRRPRQTEWDMQSEIEWHTVISNRPDRRFLYKYPQADGGGTQGEQPCWLNCLTPNQNGKERRGVNAAEKRTESVINRWFWLFKNTVLQAFFPPQWVFESRGWGC